MSLNLAGVRKILKKLAKHAKPSEPLPGFVALEISHPHEPGNRILQVRPSSFLISHLVHVHQASVHISFSHCVCNHDFKISGHYRQCQGHCSTVRCR